MEVACSQLDICSGTRRTLQVSCEQDREECVEVGVKFLRQVVSVAYAAVTASMS